MRFVAIDLFLAGLIFNDKPTAISLLENDGFFKTSTMTRIAEYMRYNKPLGKIQNLIKKAGFTASLTDCAVLEHISSVICSRSEFLCAAAVAAICQRINKQKIIIGVDSALFCTKRTLQNLESKIECLTEKKILFIIPKRRVAAERRWQPHLRPTLLVQNGIVWLSRCELLSNLLVIAKQFKPLGILEHINFFCYFRERYLFLHVAKKEIQLIFLIFMSFNLNVSF
uniref:Hexokinase C-terminal domain-containing protein n=1 Tax=Meloidogyne enterolobii TaxID=390850 RepID=A0A6V7U0L7_MELEN|nr:unnamed protein product [Meloidogyne enterolobii]